MVHLRFNKAAAALLVAVYFCALGSEAQAEESAECQRALRMADFAADQYDRRVFQDGGCIPTLNKEFKECGGDACCEAKANLKAAKCVASAESQQ
ncbi:MAG: hypothetical protein KDD66_11115, partial [Bdellovibrionales bacterium]|nr:hypothetical protein [Bdellovibrionales bacterium]